NEKHPPQRAHWPQMWPAASNGNIHFLPDDALHILPRRKNILHLVSVRYYKYDERNHTSDGEQCTTYNSHPRERLERGAIDKCAASRIPKPMLHNSIELQYAGRKKVHHNHQQESYVNRPE